MAGANKRITGMLLSLTLLFIITVIILCLMFNYDQPRYVQNPKTRPLEGVLTNTPPPTTTTTTTTTTVPSTTKEPSTTTPLTPPPPPPPPLTTTDAPTTTQSSTTPPPPPPPPLTTTDAFTTTQSSTPPPPPPPPPPPLTTTDASTTTLSSTPPPPPPLTTTDASTTTLSSTPSSLSPLTTDAAATTPSSTPLTTIDAPATTLSSTPPPSPPPLTTTIEATDTTSTHSSSPPSLTTTNFTTTTTLPSQPPPTTTAEESSSPVSHPPSTQESTTTEATTLTTEPIEEVSTLPPTTIESSTHSTDSSISPTSTTSHSSSSSTSPMPTPCPTHSTSNSTEVCMSPACKSLAARMLDMMDHSVTEPCEDFYQYACGGVLDDLFLDPENQHKVTHRFISDQLKMLSSEEPQLGPLKVFYDSCIAAEVESHNKTLWLSLVKASLDTIGNTLSTWLAGDSTDDSLITINQILVGMMKIDFTPFFDLLLDEAEDGTDRFVLKLTPPILSSSFSKDMALMVCYNEHLNRTKEALHSPSSSYFVNEDYEKYSDCIRTGKGLHIRLEQMTHAVNELDLLHHFNNSDTRSADNQLLNSRINTEFLLNDLDNILPEKTALLEAHLKKDFKNVTLSYLENKFRFDQFKVEWVMLVEELLGHPVDPDNVTIHIYFEEALFDALDVIDYSQDAPEVRRIMLILLAEKLYTDLVDQPGLGKPDYCLMVSTELMGDFVSSLYLSTLPHLQERQQKMKEMIKATKEAAEQELMHQPELKPDQLEMWLTKLRSMSGEVARPEPFQYLLPDMNETTLSDNFVDNYLFLLARYRSLMYQHYHSSTSAPAVMWNHFLKPFSPSGLSLYASNKFLMPYGATEAPLFFWDVPDYINYAGIGHKIAHELIHGFDSTGILYNGTQRHTLEGFNHFVGVSECLSNQYRANQTLRAASGLRANFTLGRLPLNEVLAGSGALRLAWEAYEHSTKSQQGRSKRAVPPHTLSVQQLLPWLDLNPLQLYFLRTAQIHCTATSETNMLSLMEKEHLPSKMWVNLMLQNEPRFTESFNCPAPLHPQCPYVLGSIPTSSTP